MTLARLTLPQICSAALPSPQGCHVIIRNNGSNGVLAKEEGEPEM